MQFFFENNEIHKISDCLNNLLQNNMYRPIIFLCIGTDKVIGDSFGPIVGQFLSREKNRIVYGNLLNTVNANNLYKINCEIKSKYINPYIVVIDSAISDKQFKNKIVIGTGGINPGSALEKKINKIGDLYINAIVCEMGENNFEELKKVKLYDVFNLSNNVANAIKKIKCLNQSNIINNYIKYREEI